MENGKLKKFLIIILICFICINAAISEEIQDAVLTTVPIEVFGENNKFGLKSETGDILVKPTYRKLIKIGSKAWICQKGSRFGLIDASGSYLVQPKYSHADRFFGKYAKLGNDNDYGLYDETGKAVIAGEYSSIDPLWGGMYLVSKNYKYGIMDAEGKELLPTGFDNIYMPERDKIRVKLDGQWYELSKAPSGDIALPDNVTKIQYEGREFLITKLVANPVAVSGYSVVSATNYALKIFSALSPAYEQTIDELMFSQGADAANVLMNFSWLPKFPLTYAKKYYNNLKAPNNGPLNDFRNELRNQIK